MLSNSSIAASHEYQVLILAVHYSSVSVASAASTSWASSSQNSQISLLNAEHTPAAFLEMWNQNCTQHTWCRTLQGNGAFHSVPEEDHNFIAFSGYQHAQRQSFRAVKDTAKIIPESQLPVLRSALCNIGFDYYSPKFINLIYPHLNLSPAFSYISSV